VRGLSGRLRPPRDGWSRWSFGGLSGTAATREQILDGFFIMIDDKQAEDLDQELIIGRGTVVSFVRLTPPVGG
jgi:hypothetical protein